MPNLSLYKKMLSSKGNKIGEVHKKNSDMIMEKTWWNDIQSCVCYLYDYKHDDEEDLNYGLHPEQSKTKIAIDAKYIVSSYNSDNKDQVSYHLQFRPSQVCNVPYYEESFVKKCGAEFPIGLFVDIKDAKGVYRRWLIHDKANAFDPQFVTYSILPCDYLFKWIYQGKKYKMWGVSRSQNSYNSGVWVDYKVETTENQRKCRLPFNDVTTTLFYNQRIIISAPIKEPITWRITKIENTAPLGINLVTFAQDLFDQHKDYIELDEDGYVIGMWADYYADGIEPEYPTETLPDTEEVFAKISYSGTKPQIKIGGSPKELLVQYYNSDGELVSHEAGEWSFTIGETDISTELDIYIDGNVVNISYIGSDDYLGEILLVRNTYSNTETDIIAEYELKIVGM